jgi:hypothetical protein
MSTGEAQSVLMGTTTTPRTQRQATTWVGCTHPFSFSTRGFNSSSSSTSMHALLWGGLWGLRLAALLRQLKPAWLHFGSAAVALVLLHTLHHTQGQIWGTA